MCFYFLGFLRLLSDPPISISPLNHPHLTKKKEKKKRRRRWLQQGRLCFLKKLKYLQSMQGRKKKKILSSAPASLHPSSKTSRSQVSPARFPPVLTSTAPTLPPLRLSEGFLKSRIRVPSDPSSGRLRQAPPKPQPTIFEAQALIQTGGLD